MKSHTYIGISCAICCALFVQMVPSVVEARHNDEQNERYERYERNSSFQDDIEDLDEDPVEDLAIPVLFGLSLSTIFPNFGDPRDGGAREHEGLDFMAPLGTPIVTPTEAVVTRVGEGDSAGLYVYTANPGGESFRYMHLDSIANIDAGDELKVGDFIGTVGDTGNAKGGAAHLHFEIRDGEALDPFPRMTEAFTLKEKMAFVETMFKDLDDEEEMAEFLVATYRSDFSQALQLGYDLPKEVEEALEDAGVVNVSSLKTKLDAIVASIPSVVTKDLTLGAQGAEVSLIQFYLVYENTGPASQALALAGATGYFGPVTASAIREYQMNADVTATGVYDKATRSAMTQ